ncbi:MAG: hypothetical protein KDB90_00580 [Planctomycetes bacterium]|nr:hypothetical protein [Planctomycetota bacterium]
MSLEIRCKCGWTSQVSDFYLGERITCPDCAEKLQVHINRNVPYGYPPYQDWAKRTAPVVRPPTYRPVARDLMVTPRDPFAGAALGLGVASVIAVLTMCGYVPGVMMAVFGLHSAHRSKLWNRHQRRPTDARARAGFALSWLALFFGALVLAGVVLGGPSDSHQPPSVTPYTAPVQPTQTPAPTPKPLRYPVAPPALPPVNTVPQPGMRYPSVPRPEPVKPRNEFERRQLKYSEKVREQRQAPGAPKPGYRYGK